MTTQEQRPWRASAKAVEGDTLSPDSTAAGPAPQELEAADLPEGITTLARALTELVAILPGLRQALESRQPGPGPGPLAYRKPVAARLCGMSPRTWERLLSAGKAPRPDAYAGKCPVWTRATLERWLREGGGRI
jgi:hypothetical protein